MKALEKKKECSSQPVNLPEKSWCELDITEIMKKVSNLQSELDRKLSEIADYCNNRS